MSILPNGIRIGAGVSEDESPAVRLDLTATVGEGIAAAQLTAAVVMKPRGARALAALLLKQADLVEGRGIRLTVVGGIDG